MTTLWDTMAEYFGWNIEEIRHALEEASLTQEDWDRDKQFCWDQVHRALQGGRDAESPDSDDGKAAP